MHDKTIRRRRAVLALLVAVSLILLTDYFGESAASPLHSVQRGIVEVFSPLQKGASTVVSPFRDIGGWFSSTFNAKSQLARYKAANAVLEQQLADQSYKVIQDKKYKALLKLDSSLNLRAYGLVSASVIGQDPVLWYKTIEVDRGSSSGVKLLDPVVGPGGLVGDVTEVESNVSFVSLLTSPKFSVDATIENHIAGPTGLIQPKLGDPSTLQLNDIVPATAQVQPGQMVVTSGFKDPSNPALQSLYPPGILIGTVSSENPQTSVLTNQQVDVSPSADLQHLSVVQILTRPHAPS